MSEQDRFWKLLEAEYYRAMMFCRKLIGDRDKGDDLYQDALVVACTRFGDLRDQAAFRPWLYRIIITTFHGTVRRPWWRRKVALAPEHEALMVPPDPGDSLSARRWLNRAFEAVSADDQALITLHELEGWPLLELAALYGKSEGAIKLQLFRARKKMKAALLKAARVAATNKKPIVAREQCVVAKPDAE
ncbi:MAG: RNA polymerase sigma factor [Candidatus Zixiibacteriota bacterium]